jgi:quercetin dioxygenase-like cupin family protein
MARRTVESPVTGETFVFDDAWNEPDGRVRRLEYALAPNKPVPPHSHPATAQSFAVVSGTLHIRVNGEARVLSAGETAATKPGDTHAQWNEGPQTVRVVEGYDPPLAIEPFFTVLPHAIASRNPFKIAVFFADFRAVSAPATFGQKAFIGAFAVLGRTLGYARWYAPLVVSGRAVR